MDVKLGMPSNAQLGGAFSASRIDFGVRICPQVGRMPKESSDRSLRQIFAAFRRTACRDVQKIEIYLESQIF
jgi:hypothetical protein